MKWLVVSLAIAASVATGCRGKERHHSTNDRVRVDAPFVNVRVGEEGGVNVRAPFTNVQTPSAPPTGSTQYAPLAPSGTSTTSRFGAPAAIPPATPTR